MKDFIGMLNSIVMVGSAVVSICAALALLLWAFEQDIPYSPEGMVIVAIASVLVMLYSALNFWVVTEV